VKALFPALILAMSCAAQAQDEMPAAGTSSPPVPAPARKAAAATEQTPGMNIVTGGEDAPFGLDIYPWRESPAERDIDRPARLLQEQVLPIDRVVFERQLDYYNALSSELKSKGLVSPKEHP